MTNKSDKYVILKDGKRHYERKVFKDGNGEYVKYNKEKHYIRVSKGHTTLYFAGSFYVEFIEPEETEEPENEVVEAVEQTENHENEVAEINSKLEIVKLKGDVKFKHPLGYAIPTGFCFKHPEKGYLAFEADKQCIPYIPIGGKRALKKILETGGFWTFEGIKWIQPMTA